MQRPGLTRWRKDLPAPLACWATFCEERQLEERCEELENYTRRNNLQVYGISDGAESGDMDHDFSPTLQKKRCEYGEIKRQLRETNIKFQTPYPAKLRVHLKEGIKAYNSAWEAAEALQSMGIKSSISN